MLSGCGLVIPVPEFDRSHHSDLSRLANQLFSLITLTFLVAVNFGLNGQVVAFAV